MSSTRSESVPSRTGLQGPAVQADGQPAEPLPTDAAALRGRTELRLPPPSIDHGSVRQFAHLYGDQFRHAKGLGWFVWDDHRWKRVGGERALLPGRQGGGRTSPRQRPERADCPSQEPSSDHPRPQRPRR
ncbi:hypothetical protein ACIQ6Y_32010 [Streptomyces sp. NPDC096205]|uniref:hypothetical protein n=1 Tax=Streptomyces sp. NPDC096205 TaxID=3366081 RepID=UPI0038156B56